MEEKKSGSRNSTLVIVVVIVLVAIAGFIYVNNSTEVIDNSSGTNTNTNSDTNSEDVSDISTIANAMKLGSSMKCTINMEAEEGSEAAELTYWVKGENVRIETQMSGKSTVVITRDGITYSQMDGYGVDESCDWFSMKDSGNQFNEEGYNDYSEYDAYTEEEDPSTDEEYDLQDKLKCAVAVFGDEKFETPGKVCELSY